MPVMRSLHSRGDFGKAVVYVTTITDQVNVAAMPGEQQGPNHTLGKLSRNSPMVMLNGIFPRSAGVFCLKYPYALICRQQKALLETHPS